MSKPPAFQLYAADLILDTQDWTDEELGVHMRLLCWSWVNKRGIPTDFERMKRIAPGAEKCWSIVGKKWVKGPENTWINERLETTRSTSNAFRELQKAKSDKAAKARKRKTVKRKSPAGKPAETPTGLSDDTPAGKPADHPLEDEVEVEEGGINSEVERAGANDDVPPQPPAKPSGPDPNVQAVIDHLTAGLKAHGIPALDRDLLGGGNGRRPTDGNRAYANNLIKAMEKHFQGFDAVTSAKDLIDIALADDFHRPNCTKVRYLYNNMQKLIAKARGSRNNPKTDHDYAQDVARHVAERIASRRTEQA